MATGTGKTITSRAAAVSRRNALGRLALVILVPYVHLLDQWQRVCRDFGFHPHLCSGEHHGWELSTQSVLQDFRLGSINDVCLIAVHNTAASAKFGRTCRMLPPQYAMLIADEVHGLGAPELGKALLPAFDLRMGLSATPQRWYDDEGTAFLLSYFGGVCFEYPLETAIGKYLVPYEYYPVPVCLTGEERADYGDRTARIVALAGMAAENHEVRERLKKLLLDRARIIGSASNKLPRLIELLRQLVPANARIGDELRDILVYCDTITAVRA